MFARKQVEKCLVRNKEWKIRLVVCYTCFFVLLFVGTKVVKIYKTKKDCFFEETVSIFVTKPGLEPGTPSLKGMCSTDWATWSPKMRLQKYNFYLNLQNFWEKKMKCNFQIVEIQNNNLNLNSAEFGLWMAFFELVIAF